MKYLLVFLRTINNLGFYSCLRVSFYRLLIKKGFFKFVNKVNSCPYPKVKNELLVKKIKLNSNLNSKSKRICLTKADMIINGFLFYFGE